MSVTGLNDQGHNIIHKYTQALINQSLPLLIFSHSLKDQMNCVLCMYKCTKYTTSNTYEQAFRQV